ncbi:MAG: PEGA domain-containing protein [Pseudomonadota bacterium]
MKIDFRIALLAALFLLGGCASIIHGTTQTIGISSSPSNATVKSNGLVLGNTPLTAELSRKENHIIAIELEGYLPFETTLTRSASGWVWGNIVFGGLIGLAVDAISGGFYKLTPEQIEAELLAGSANAKVNSEGLYVFVALEPNPAWEQIGQLARQ